MQFSEREVELIRYLLDPKTQIGEMRVWSMEFFKRLRERGVMPEGLLGVAGGGGGRGRVGKRREHVFPNFGKHANEAFDDIPRDYLEWIINVWYVQRLDAEGRERWADLDQEITEYLRDAP